MAAGSCHTIKTKQELEKAVAEIGQWEALCGHLGTPEAVLSELRHSQMETREKKSRCLEAYYNTGKACWERVVKVVAEFPIQIKKIAEQIAHDHGIHYSSVVIDEL